MKNYPTYVSTRNNAEQVSPSKAIIQGLATDGGLYVPENIDSIQFDLKAFNNLSYPELAKTILSRFLDFDEEAIDACIRGAYQSGKFDIDELVETKIFPNHAILELHHGPTSAFKDMALTILPYLMRQALINTGEDKKILILTATSGDTGKAALEGFKDVDNTAICVFYPKDGVSVIQQQQMQTTEGENTYVIGVEGNFDDTQNGVKAIFSDPVMKQKAEEAGFILSSANSINIGRLLPQIVYYYKSYFDLVRNGRIELGDEINFCVPTGNFGDILAGYYAKKTGLPVSTLICASNQNDVLTDFFETGSYDKDRDFFKTISPSMDILISSNLERLLYDRLDGNDKEVSQLMQSLADKKNYHVDKNLLYGFSAGSASDDETKEIILKTYQENQELIDPHTAVAQKVLKDYRDRTGDEHYTVVLSTASPYKFSSAVYEALNPEKRIEEDAYRIQETLAEETGTVIPKPLQGLKERTVRHHSVCAKEEMADQVSAVLTERRDV